MLIPREWQNSYTSHPYAYTAPHQSTGTASNAQRAFQSQYNKHSNIIAPPLFEQYSECTYIQKAGHVNVSINLATIAVSSYNEYSGYQAYSHVTIKTITNPMHKTMACSKLYWTGDYVAKL